MNKSLCAYPSWRSENGMSMDNVRMAFSTMVGARKKCNECNYKHFCIILTLYFNDIYVTAASYPSRKIKYFKLNTCVAL